MEIPLSEALKALCGDAPPTGRNVIGSAGLTEEAKWERLSNHFVLAVERLTEAHGTPEFSGPGQTSPKTGFHGRPSNIVDQIAYWNRGQTYLYALLLLEDNTRHRELILGVCPRRDVQNRPRDPYWSRQPGDPYWDE